MSIDEIRWRQRLTDSTHGVAAVKELVIAELYVLVPFGIAPPAWLTRVHPSGQSVVPCFLSERSARLTAAGHAQLVRVPGRDLFGSLPMTSAWIDPDGVGLLLTPALMQVMLKSVPSPEPIGTDRTLSSWSGSDDLPAPVHRAWAGVLSQFPHVVSAYWLRKSDAGSLHRRVVVVTRNEHDTSRLLDTMVVALRANYAGQMRVEAQALSDGQSPEAQRRLEMFNPFYSAQRTPSAPGREDNDATRGRDGPTVH